MQNSISYLRSSNNNKHNMSGSGDGDPDYVRYWEGQLAIAYRTLTSDWYEDDLYVALSFLPYRKSIMLVVPYIRPHSLVVRQEIIRLFGSPFNSRHQGHLSYLDREIIIVSEATAYQSMMGYEGDIFRLDEESMLIRPQRGDIHHVR
ncbi:hypothetical protein EalM132_00193 [Exiguobacterium phage vB_EalM-132]|nr:hypothetical protein EalM132_00023 [Exiguobacterium phage vB_EalM-132]AYP68705.1 hypothetical protein EalM132_00193 [Exiguobacterium phage vB_EalM-132]